MSETTETDEREPLTAEEREWAKHMAGAVSSRSFTYLFLLRALADLDRKDEEIDQLRARVKALAQDTVTYVTRHGLPKEATDG